MDKLFAIDFGIARSDSELRKIQEDNNDYDPAYITASCHYRRRDTKQWLEDLWSQYREYADRNFLKEARRSYFSQRMWEMYLACVLLEKGIPLVPRGERSEREKGPDIQIKEGSKDIWIEAVVPQGGKGRDAVPRLVYDAVSDYPEEQILLRATNSLYEKLKAYEKWHRDNLVRDGDNCIIAINLGSMSHPTLDPGIPSILKCLFGISYLTIPIRKGERREPFWSERKEIYKRSGSAVRMNLFEDPEFSRVSAVLTSNDNIINSPKEKNKMGNNFIIVYNHHATNLLPRDVFSFGVHWRKEGNRLKKF